MADDNMDIAKRLDAAVPIAQLGPDASRDSAVHGMVTIVWPFNKVNNSVAFILAEPEARLRLAKGQIRVNCVGASAKAISECGLGSGDKVRLRLEGVDFVANDAKARMPGTESEWQLSFSKRLVLEAKVGYTEETKTIDVDASSEPEVVPPAPPSPVPEPEIELDIPVLPSATPAKNTSLQLKDGEFESPAFVKRARISYGGLFEGDPFEDDGGVKGKGRKRTRFSLDPRSWRYTSRSPSPEESQEEEEEKEIPRPQMADGECQTMELDFPEPLPEVASKPQGVTIPTSSTTTDQGHQTVSQGTWTTLDPQEQFTGAILSPSKAAFDDPSLHAGEHVEWNEQPLPYPGFSHAAPENPFASLDRSFESQIPNGFGSDLLPQHDSFVHPNPFAYGDGIGPEIHGNQSHERTVYPDPDHYDSTKSAGQVPTASSFAEPGVPPAEATVTVPADPYARETSVPSERAAFNAGTSTWAAVNQRDNRSTSRPVSSRHSGDGQTPQSAMVIDESDSEEEAPLEDTQYGSLGDAPVSHPDHVARALEEAARNPLTEGPPPGHDITEEDWEEEVHAYTDHDPDRYDDEYDEDEEGGDYDTSNYLAPQDDEDDGDDVDLRQHRLEPEFNDGEGETSFDEEEYDKEEDYDEEEEEEVQAEINRMAPPRRPAQRPASSAPVVIDLLSDSDDDEPPPRPPPSTMPARPQLSMQAAVSPDYGPDSEESEVEEEEDAEEEGGEEDEGESEGESVGESEEVPTVNADFDSDQEDSGIESEDAAGEADEPLENDERADIPGLQSSPIQVTPSARAVPLRIASEPTEIDADIKGPSMDESQTTSQDGQPDFIQQEPANVFEQPSIQPADAFEQPSIEPARQEEFQTIELENIPTKVKSEPMIEAPSSPPLTQSFSSPTSKLQDVVMEEAVAETLAPEEPLPTPADTQSKDIQPIETDMEMADVADSHPAEALADVVDSTTTIVEEAVVVRENTPEQASSPRTQPETVADALKAVAEAGAIEEVADEIMEDAIAVKEAVEEALEDSQLPPTAADSDLAFETQEGGRDALQAALDADAQPITQVPATSDHDFDDVISLASQLSGDDALQAALREENSRYYDSDENETMIMEVSQDLDEETATSEQPPEEHVAASSSADTQDQDMLEEQATAEVDAQDEPAPVSSPALPGSPHVGFQADIQPEDQPEDEPEIQVEIQPEPQEDIQPEAHESSPDIGADEHVNEAGLPMGSPEWTVKERHEHEEPNVRASSTASRATPVTHKNEAGLTVGSPERAAIEHHQEEDVPVDANPTPEVETEPFIGSPERAAMERHQHERSVPDGPKSKEKTETESFIGSPERAAIEQHQEHEQVQEEEVPAAPEAPDAPETTPVQQKVEDFFIGSPEKTAKRRSQQKDQDSDDFTSDPSLRLARAAIASRNGHRVSPANSRPQTRSKSFQKSPTPELPDNSVQIARASLHTPSKTGRNEAPVASSPASSKVEEEASSLTASKLKLVRHLRDQLSECTTLKVLRQNTGKSVEVMAVAMMTPPTPVRAKGGPREYMMSFTITDHSISPSGVSEVQLYRPHKESLPQVKHGDVVLLRNFTVVALKGKGYGLRTNEGSSWAVFDREDEPPQIKGPPVEYGEAETTFAAYLREWYGLLDDKAKEKLEKANRKIMEAGKAK
ncbi:methionyl-tRNA synthetase [Pestalotiopsis sp. IQ-011]